MGVDRILSQVRDDLKIHADDWIEYPSKQVRDAANEKMRTDPRMKAMGENMPFDGKRMVFGGFVPIVDENA